MGSVLVATLEEGVLVLTVNRPERGNAIDPELRDALAYRHVSHRLTDLVESIERLEKPVVAAIDGVVTGAGLALALACDWRAPEFRGA